MSGAQPGPGWGPAGEQQQGRTMRHPATAAMVDAAQEELRARHVANMTALQKALYEVFEADVKEWHTTGIPPITFLGLYDCRGMTSLREKMEYMITMVRSAVEVQNSAFSLYGRTDWPRMPTPPMAKSLGSFSEPAKVGMSIYIEFIMGKGGTLTSGMTINERDQLMSDWRRKSPRVRVTLTPREQVEHRAESSARPDAADHHDKLVLPNEVLRALICFRSQDPAVIDEGGVSQRREMQPNTLDVQVVRELCQQQKEMALRDITFQDCQQTVIDEASRFVATVIRDEKAGGMIVCQPRDGSRRFLTDIWAGNGEVVNAVKSVVSRCFRTLKEYHRATVRTATPFVTDREAAAETDTLVNVGQTNVVQLEATEPFIQNVILLWTRVLETHTDMGVSYWSTNGEVPEGEATVEMERPFTPLAPPAWIYGLKGGRFMSMYRRRVEWSQQYCARTALHHKRGVIRRPMPGNEEQWQESVLSRLPARMRDEHVREWATNPDNELEAWDLLWELVRHEDMQGSVWGEQRQLNVNAWLTWQALGLICILCKFQVQYVGVPRKREEGCTEWLVERAVTGGNKPMPSIRAARDPSARVAISRARTIPLRFQDLDELRLRHRRTAWSSIPTEAGGSRTPADHPPVRDRGRVSGRVRAKCRAAAGHLDGVTAQGAHVLQYHGVPTVLRDRSQTNGAAGGKARNDSGK